MVVTSGNGDVIGRQQTTQPLQEASAYENPKTNIEHLPRFWVFMDTLLSYAVHLASAFTYGMLCQSLGEFQLQTSSSTDEISVIYTWRGGGIFIGCLLLGHVYDHMNHALIMGCSVLVSGVANLLLPHFSSLLTVSALFGVQGVAIGAAHTGSTMVLINYWRKNPAPFLQIQALMYSLGALLSPLIARPFLEESTSYQDNTFNDDFSSNYTILLGSSNRSIDMHATKQSKNETKINVFDTAPGYYINIKIVYSIIGAYICVVAVCCFMMVLKFKTWRNTLRGDRKAKSGVLENMTKERKGLLVTFTLVVKVLMLTLVMVLLCSTEASFGTFLITFALDYLEWQKGSAMWLSTSAFFSNSIGLLAGALLSKWLNPLYLAAADALVATACIIVMTSLVTVHPAVMWTVSVTIGLAFSTLVSSTLAWATTKVKPTGKITATFTTTFSLSLILGPKCIGHFFDKLGAMWFCYILLANILMADIIFVITWLLLRLSQGPRYYEVARDVVISEGDVDDDKQLENEL